MPSIELKHGEANALVRAIVEAKFRPPPHEDVEVLTSPMVARVVSELAVAAELEAEAAHGAKARQDWQRWMTISSDRPEWAVALLNAEEALSSAWRGWSASQRSDAVVLLFAPFRCADTSKFVAELDERLARLG
jgi:hypothetical protein